MEPITKVHFLIELWLISLLFFPKKKKKHVYNEKINSSNDSYKQYHKYSQIKSNVKARENV
jgi:hypothetical protein